MSNPLANKAGCPTPKKTKYLTPQDAEMAIRELGNPKLRVYLCECGSYHLTKSKLRFTGGRYF